ncbi:MAG: FAD-dependent oxidoreductase [Lachnospiraceae bacterium]|nr:FAD-dependent oxidoreductase [Lachnospiraceae bacterium]
MRREQADLVIIGGGPAGLAAAVAAYDSGVRDLLILERDSHAGGILQQCIHNGFGLHRFQKELTGPEYAGEYEKMVAERNIAIRCGSMVLNVSPEKVITVVSQEGVTQIQAKAVILAMGCRERSRGALNIPGSRPAGIFSAGTAQKYVNCMGYLPGREVVILGSGDIGLIMARRMTLEGAKVKAVCELMPYSGGLARNIQQCLKDFDIPLKLSHTVTAIHGKERLTGVTVSQVDEKRRPIPGTEEEISCDTLLLSVGLIPENELSKEAGIRLDPVTGGAVVDEKRQTSCPGIFACGNVLHVHDLVDFVSEEAALAGESAAAYIAGKVSQDDVLELVPDGKIRYTVPQRIADRQEDVKVYFRVDNVYRKVEIRVTCDGETVLAKKRPVVKPGEMESLVLTKEQLAKCHGSRLEFTLVSG